MPISTNVFRLNDVYDLVNAGCLPYTTTGDGGQLWSWGGDNGGSLGTNTNCVDQCSPVQVPGSSWLDISSGGAFGVTTVLARKTGGTLWSWGYGARGQLGADIGGFGTSRSSPIQVPGTSWNDIAIGGTHSLARKTDGTLWSWGYNYQGQLALGNKIHRSSPVQIAGTSWNDIATGLNHSLARKTDGTLWSWGYNARGQLGNDTTVSTSSPIQVPGTSWNDVSTGTGHTLARKTDGTLWVWGLNQYGQLGDNTQGFFTNPKSSPIQIPGTSWNDISAGRCFSLARKTDGTLWVWGQNNRGQLGDNTIVPKSSPVQIPGASWNDISGGNVHTLARKTDGTLWAWGCNRISNYSCGGLLGDSTQIHRSSPVQVPGTSWNDIAAGYSASFARKAI